MIGVFICVINQDQGDENKNEILTKNNWIEDN